MFAYCRGTDLTTLADHLLEELRENPPENPLAPEIFVVQNHGMAQWLSLYMAEKKGIAANLNFEFPAERIWKLIRATDPNVPETLPSDRGPMTWAIMHILKNDDDSDLDILQHYIQESDPLKKELRRWKLAGRIADTFDQYLTYRPEMLMAWEQRKLVTTYADERWQSVLWRKLTEHWKGYDKPDYQHRVLLQNKISTALDDGTISKDKLPERVSVFGVSTMPPVYLRILVKLSKLTDVFFYTLDPGNESHPLNESLGETGHEYRNLLERFIDEEGVNAEVEPIDKKVGYHSQTLFKAFKTDLLGSDAGTGNIEYPASGIQYPSSVQVHSCHSPRREVEVLYDQLLAMFDEDEALNPSDVVVLAPDLQAYAPEIEAVFGTAEEELYQIPYHLAERSTGTGNPVHLTVSKLLALAESRFKVTDLLDFLDSESIRQKFTLSDEHLNILERWIADNRIRWGKDGHSKSSLGLPESDSFTWQSGLNRMMLGYAMRPEDDELFNGTYPYSEIEQSEDALLAGRFSHLLNLLFHFHDEVKESRTIEEWSTVLKEWLFKFFSEDESYFRDIQKVRDVINNLREHGELSGFEERVPYQVMRSYLQDALDQQQTGGGWTGKGVAFSSMVSMRNIPAKVICLLGMNDGAFPRSKMPVAFDLINRDPQLGDRSRNSEDRQLFLEVLLAAKERIYLSYVGQSNRQDTEYPPSVVLRELIDYLLDRYSLKEKELVTEHRLQAFSPAYFKSADQSRLFSYSEKNRSIAQTLKQTIAENPQFLTSKLPEPNPEYKRLSLGELIRFFQHPSKYLLQNRLGIYLYEEQVLGEDREAFLLSGLEGYQLGQELLERYLNNKSLDAFEKVAFATDFLPDGWPGEQEFQQKKAEVTRFGNNLQEVLGQEKLDPLEVDVEIADFRMTGKLNQVYESGQELYRFGSMRPKDLIELWIKHLALQIVKPESHPGESRLYTRDKKKPIVFHQLPSISKPETILEDLLTIYKNGLSENSYFFPDTSFAFAQEICYKNNDEEKGIKAASYKWKDDYGRYPKEGDDAYNKLLMGDANPLTEKKFIDTSISFWKPFFAVLNKDRK